MTDTRTEAALARIDAALARLDAIASAPSPSHEALPTNAALRDKVAKILGDLDTLIAEVER